MNRKTSKGFTLPEVLIALVITSLLLTGLLTTFQAGLQAYQRLELKSNQNHQIRILLTKLDRELHNMFSYKKAAFIGSSTEFSFPTRIQDFSEEKTEPELTQIHYQFDRGRLLRKSTPIQYSFNRRSNSFKTLSEDFTVFNLEYAYYDSENEKIIWLSDWPEGLGLPKGIKLTLALREAEDREVFTIQKHFYIEQGNWGWIPKAQS